MTRSSRRKRARDALEPASSGARRALDATPFTAAEAAQFAEDGFIILRGVIPAAECRRFLRMAVNPAMAKQGILAGDRSTWPREDDEDSRWPALFGSARLHAVLDSLHGGRDRWSWQHGAAHGVGWIHLRFPVVDGLLWTVMGCRCHCHDHRHYCHRHLTSSTSLPCSRPTPTRASGTSTATRTASTPSSLWSSSRS